MSNTRFGMHYGDFTKFSETVQGAISEAKWREWLSKAAQKAYEKAYKLCPVKTGLMKGNLYVEEGLDFFILADDVEYASYNEWGWLNESYGGTPEKPKHYKGGYRPFMRPGLLAGEKEFKRQVQRWVNRFLSSGK